MESRLEALAHHEPDPSRVLDADDRLVAAAKLFRNASLQPQLDALVAETAKRAGFPIAAISIVLRRTQRFIAAVGLPPDLEASRATDRCASFCQFIVATDRPLCVPDTNECPDLPRALIESYGLRAYAGVPIHSEDQVIGSLCVIDVVPHSLDDTTLEVLRSVAEKIDEILASPARKTRALAGRAVRPAFAELRNVLCRISMAGGLMDAALADLAGGSELLAAAARGELNSEQLARNAAVLGAGQAAVNDVRNLLRNFASDIDQASVVIDAVETTVSPDGGDIAWVYQVLSAALTTALHETRCAGGVKIQPFDANLALHADLPEAACALAAALIEMSQASSPKSGSRLTLRVEPHDQYVDFLVAGPPLADDELAKVSASMARLMGGAPMATASCTRDGITLRFDAIQPALD